MFSVYSIVSFMQWCWACRKQENVISNHFSAPAYFNGHLLFLLLGTAHKAWRKPTHTTVSENLPVWVGDDTQWWIIFHSHLLFYEWIYHFHALIECKRPPQHHCNLSHTEIAMIVLFNQIQNSHFAANFSLLPSFWNSNFPLWHPSRIVILGHCHTIAI